MGSSTDRSSLAPDLVSVEELEDAPAESEEEEQVQEDLPVIDDDGVVHLTRTTAKGG